MRIHKSALAVLLCVACSSTRAREFVSLERGTQSGVQGSGTVVIRDAALWEAIWKRHASVRVEGAPRPEVDFERQMVVLVSCGLQDSTGYALEVVSVEEREGKLIIEARASEPARDLLQAQVATVPYEFIVLLRSDLPVELHVKS
jgi:hypothetical protein